jgi:hypothetical protein
MLDAHVAGADLNRQLWNLLVFSSGTIAERPGPV